MLMMSPRQRPPELGEALKMQFMFYNRRWLMLTGAKRGPDSWGWIFKGWWERRPGIILPCIEFSLQKHQSASSFSREIRGPQVQDPCCYWVQMFITASHYSLFKPHRSIRTYSIDILSQVPSFFRSAPLSTLYKSISFMMQSVLSLKTSAFRCTENDEGIDDLQYNEGLLGAPKKWRLVAQRIDQGTCRQQP